ncbi:MAG: prepilin-type N-terminal cleavage/methylation domain-containing protein [Erysipelotrichaceae bacterium]|nr:prepilin-type N-terminal cleavage/methylation domain-containing protein [Erysipelotrichaceae bacterium]
MRKVFKGSNPFKNKKGFTLIELIITMAVLSIFTYLIAMLVQNSMGFFKDEESQVANQAALRIVAVQFEKDVRRHVFGNEELVISGNCYTITPVYEASVSYCLVGSSVVRNGTVIANGVSQFSASPYRISDNSVLLTIKSNADRYGRVNEVVVRIFVRVGS